MITGESKVVDSFEMRIADIKDADLEQLHALSISVGWPHRAEDWQFMREIGKGIVALDEIGRVQSSAMWFPYDTHFAMIGMVITSPRLQSNGAGLWMMKHVMDRLTDRDLGLSATRAAIRLYRHLNFTAEAAVFQCQGETVLPPDVEEMPDAMLRSLEPDDLEAVAALDGLAFGADRTPLLARLLDCSDSFGLFRDGKMTAYSCCRRFGRGHVIGPVVAVNDIDAIAIVRPHVAEHAGSFLRLDTREAEGRFSEFLSRCGLPVYDTVTTMSLGRPWVAAPERQVPMAPKTYALASQALG